MVTKRSNYTKKSSSTKSVSDIVADKIVQKILETEKLPWQKDFKMGRCMNWATQRPYSGINLFLLFNGSGEYLTFKQLQDYNEKNKTDFMIKKGSSSEMVVFNQKKDKLISEEQAKKLKESGKSAYVIMDAAGNYYHRLWQLRYYRVFDIANIENSKGEKLPTRFKANESDGKFQNTTIEDAVSKYCKTTGVKIAGPRGDSPFYTQTTDTVHIPKKEQFKSENSYYGTLLHELTHSTGIKSRLHRTCYREYHADIKERGREEFVAEIGSWLLMGELGVSLEGHEFDNSLNYVHGWCDWMKNNSSELLKGMAEAEKAKDYILAGGEAKKDEKKIEKEKENVKKSLEDTLKDLITSSIKNNNRAQKTWKRITDANADKYLNELGFTKVVETAGVPTLQFIINKSTRIVAGMTFALLVNDQNEYKLLYSLERGDTLLRAAELAKKYRIKPLLELINMMNLRRKLPTYDLVGK